MYKWFQSLPLIVKIALIVVLLAIAYLAFDGGWNWIRGTYASARITAAENRADAAEKRAAAAETEKEQFKGAAAAFQQQAKDLTNEIVELTNERPELQKRSAAAGQRVEAIRNRAVRPIDDNIRERVEVVGSKLDNLYPDK